MMRSRLVTVLGAAVVAVGLAPVPGHAQAPADGLAGRWTLDWQLSQLPIDIGFGVAWLPSGARAAGLGVDDAAAGAPVGAPLRLPESEDDARRVAQLTGEVRQPPAHLAILDTSAAVAITYDGRWSRTFQPDGQEGLLQLDGGVPVAVVARREIGRLLVTYEVEPGRQLRYTYSRLADPPRLIVQADFLDRGQIVDAVRRVYVPQTLEADAREAAAAAAARPPAPAKPVSAAPAGAAPSGADPRGVPAARDVAPGETIDQRPDANLQGLTKLNVVVDGLEGSKAAESCGLTRDAMEAAVSKRLTDAGFTVLQHTSEDSYLYVNIVTVNPSPGSCVARYDVDLDTNTSARLSYHDRPVLVQVQLLHQGGLAGGGSKTFAADVLKGVLGYVDQFIDRIHKAGK